MISTLFIAGLLLLPSAHAFWRLPCTRSVLDSRVDPIVNPGKPSGHSHTIMGASDIDLFSTSDTLRNSDCSSCKVKDDKSAYWIPQLFYEYKNGSYQAVSHHGMLVYYLQRNAQNETVVAFPDGLRMLTGNPYARSDPGTGQAISWLCLNYNAPYKDQTPGFNGNTDCPDGLRAQVFFPACWDGVNLDSPDHKSHMAYPEGIDNGLCPFTHPIHVISIFYEVLFDVDSFNKLNDGGRFVLSNGDSTGYGLHGDFMNGWDRSVLSRAVDTCTNLSGVIEDCGVFNNEGRFYTDAENDACSATNPVQESDDVLLPNLPGCIAVTDGPAPATAADVVPNCVPAPAVGAAAAAPAAAASTAPQQVSSSSASAAAGSASTPPSLNSAAGTPAPTANQLAAASTIPASTFTTDAAAASGMIPGASPVSAPAVSPSPSPSGEDNSGQCGPVNNGAHRRSRMQRRHGSRRDN